MKYKNWLLSVTILLFVSVCILCVTRLFVVADFNVDYSVFNRESYEDVQTLLNEYKGKSIFTISCDDIKEKITSNRLLKVISVKKCYPNSISINLIERVESYYVQWDDCHYILDNELFVLYKIDGKYEGNLKRLNYINIDKSTVNFQLDVKTTCSLPKGTNDMVLTMFKSFGEFYDNITDMTVTFTDDENLYVRFDMIEGVSIEVVKANVLGMEKLDKGIQTYKNLSEDRLICGSIIVVLLDNGEIVANHSFSSN